MPRILKSDLICDDTIDLLHKFQILKHLTRKQIVSLLGKDVAGYESYIAKLVEFEAGEVVIKEGQFDSWVFWVVTGEFAVIKEGVVIAVFDRPGEVFGEMSILAGDSRTASVVAEKKGVCLSIDMSILDNLADVRLKDQIAEKIQQLKSERFNLTTNKLVAEKKKIAQQIEQLKKQQQRLDEKEQALAEKERRLGRKNGRV